MQARTPQGVSQEHGWLRFVADRPVRALTSAFVSWVCGTGAAWGKTALLLGWDTASWHGSQAVRQWLREHNRQVNREGHGSRLVRCPFPSKSPGLNPLEAQWVQGKRAVVAPARLLTAVELVERVTTHCGCPPQEPLSIPQEAS